MTDKGRKKTPLQNRAEIKTATQAKEGTGGRTSFRLMVIFFLTVLSVIVYANSLNDQYALDDVAAVTQNTLVQKGFAGIPELLHTPYHWGFRAITNDLYRPLSLVLFAIEHEIAGQNPVVGHGVNILLFACCAVLLFLFLDRLFDGKRTVVALIASVLFALHPIHTEVVDNVKSCDELLCFVFAMLTCLAYMDYAAAGKPVKLIAGSCFLFLALLSKETSITFLVIIPAIFFLYKGEQRKRSIHITVLALLSAVVFLAIRFSVLSSYHSDHFFENYVMKNALAMPGLSMESRLATAVLMLGYYLRLLFIPYPLVCDYSFNSIPFTYFSSPAVLLSLIIYLFLAGLAVRRLISDRRDPFAFGILFFLVTLSLVSNIFFLTGTTMAERLLFFPSVGFCLVIALLLEKIAGKTSGGDMALIKNPKVMAIAIPVCLLYGGITIARNSDWQNNETLFSADVIKEQGNSRLNFFLGDILVNNAMAENNPAIKKESFTKAYTYLSRSIAIYPGLASAHFDMARVYMNLDKADSAEVHYEAAVALDSNDNNFSDELARLYFATKKYRQCAELNKKALRLSPNNAALMANVGYIYLCAGIYDSAIAYSQRTLAVDTTFKGTYQVLSHAYAARNDRDSAAKYEALAQKYTPGYNLQY